MLEDAARIQRLWTLELNTIFSKKPEEITEVDKSLYERLVYDWVVQFIDIYHTRHITPYIHTMKCHVGEFLHLHGAILPFTTARAGKVQ